MATLTPAHPFPVTTDDSHWSDTSDGDGEVHDTISPNLNPSYSNGRTSLPSGSGAALQSHMIGTTPSMLDENSQLVASGQQHNRTETTWVTQQIRLIDKDYAIEWDRILGEPGRFGTAYLCWKQPTDFERGKPDWQRVLRCCKQINKATLSLVSSKQEQDRLFAAIAREIGVLKYVDHPGIVKLFDVYESRHQIHLITEYLPGGELFHRIAELSSGGSGGASVVDGVAAAGQDNVFSEKLVADIFEQILKALGYLHSRGIMHLDLKPENILFESKDSNKIKLIDFGVARVAPRFAKLQQKVGTTAYMAPELIKGKYGLAADIWSVGVILFCMVFGFQPFSDDTLQEYMSNKEAKLLVSQREQANERLHPKSARNILANNGSNANNSDNNANNPNKSANANNAQHDSSQQGSAKANKNEKSAREDGSKTSSNSNKNNDNNNSNSNKIVKNKNSLSSNKSNESESKASDESDMKSSHSGAVATYAHNKEDVAQLVHITGTADEKVEYMITRIGFINKVIDGYGPWFPSDIPISDHLMYLISKMLDSDVERRWTVVQCLDSEWLRGQLSNDSMPQIVQAGLLQFDKHSQFKAAISALFYEIIDESHVREIEKVFKKLDKNQDGLLSREEFTQGMTDIFNTTLDRSELNRIFDNADIDRNGNLTIDELIIVATHQALIGEDARLHRVFNELDADHDGFVTYAELLNIEQIDVLQRSKAKDGRFYQRIKKTFEEALSNLPEKDEIRLDYEAFLRVIHPDFDENMSLTDFATRKDKVPHRARGSEFGVNFGLPSVEFDYGLRVGLQLSQANFGPMLDDEERVDLYGQNSVVMRDIESDHDVSDSDDWKGSAPTTAGPGGTGGIGHKVMGGTIGNLKSELRRKDQMIKDLTRDLKVKEEIINEMKKEINAKDKLLERAIHSKMKSLESLDNLLSVSGSGSNTNLMNGGTSSANLLKKKSGSVSKGSK